MHIIKIIVSEIGYSAGQRRQTLKAMNLTNMEVNSNYVKIE